MKALIALPILTGLFIGTSYIPFPPWAMLFGIAPLAVAWYRLAQAISNEGATGEKGALRALRVLTWRGFFLGWIAQFILNAIGFHWISTTAIEFGHFPMWAGVLVLAGFCAIAHLYYGLTGALVLYIAARLKARGFKFSPISFMILTFSLFAMLESLWPSIFPWHLGYTWLWAGLPGAQFADVIGFEGLNLVALACNALFAIGWVKWERSAPKLLERARPSALWVLGGVALFIVINVLGLGRADHWKQTNDELKLLIVQGNIGNYEKLIVEKQKDFSIPIVATYVRLSAEGLDKHPETTHILWPETAYPDYLDQDFQSEPNWISVQQFAMMRRQTILTGGYSYDRRKRETYNGLFAMGPHGMLVTPPYRKSILIPFGEKFPFSDVIPYMKWLFPGMGAFGQGHGPVALDVGAFRMGPQICLESLYPAFSAAMARQGAEIFANVTNDSWFGRTFEPYQHMTMTLARAIENRRPLLRSTNTGISTVILADGTVLEKSPIGVEWTGFYKVPFIKNPPVTMYSCVAGYSPWLAAVLAVFSVAIPLFIERSRRSRRRDQA